MKILYFLPLILQTLHVCAQKRAIPIEDPIPVDPIILCNSPDQAICLNNPRCWWDATEYCANNVECSKVALADCASTKLCHLNPPALGFCSGPPAHCSGYTQEQCQNDFFCNWISSYQCTYKDPMPAFPDCYSMNPVQCAKNSAFCNLAGTCYDNKSFCSGLSYSQCLTDPLCKYTFTQKEQCLENDKFCTALNEKDCLKNSKYCLGLNTAPQCVNQFNCNGLTLDQCKLNSKYCTSLITKPTCTPRKNLCSTYTTPLACKNAGCLGSINTAGQFKCSYPYACSSYTEAQCKANDKYCIYTPGSFTCKNSVDCTVIYDPLLCKTNKYCKYIPSVFKCIGKKQGCNLLQGAACKQNPACTYIPSAGYCSQLGAFGCSSLKPLDCMNNKHCLLKYSCTPKKIPNCNLLSQEDCKNSIWCQLVDKGKCFDKKIDCDIPYDQCIVTRPCVWNPGSSGSCENDFNCTGLNAKDCYEYSNYCHLYTGGCQYKTK